MRAMILAAGRGTRMRPLTDNTPKPLLHVGGKPLIVWHIERLVSAGIREIIINHAWLGKQIEETLGRGEQFGAQLQYSAETTALETAGGIAKALWFFQDTPFLVINGDVWCDWNPAHALPCAQVLAQSQTLAWLLMVKNPTHNPNGDFLLDHSPYRPTNVKAEQLLALRSPECSQVQLSEYPAPGHQKGRALTFAGIGLYNPDLFTMLLSDRPAALAPILRNAIAQNRVIGTQYRGDWVDVGTPERLNLLKQRLALKG